MDGTDIEFFVDGTSLGSSTYTVNIPDLTGNFHVGVYNSGSLGMYHNGYLDEFRISKGIAR